LLIVEREKSQKKPTLGKMGYQLGTTALISKDNYNAFRITCIMLILGNLNASLSVIIFTVSIML
ncbi:hypothetical protein, partial [Acinetobacter towneri]|uniref:hypothetical protein n=1 Tax=Acinetobacter towneri TaxID=202956 RepID=UPI0032142458